jgi:hypothetical protein
MTFIQTEKLSDIFGSEEKAQKVAAWNAYCFGIGDLVSIVYKTANNLELGVD